MEIPSEASIYKNKGTKQIITAAFTYSTIFFVAGLIYDLTLYILTGEWIMYLVNSLAALSMTGVFIVYRIGKSSPDTGLLINMFIISFNLSFSMIYEGVAAQPDASFQVLLGMCICTMPIILSALTVSRWAPLTMTLLAVCSYTVSALLLDDDQLFYSMPTLLLIYIGAPIALRSIIIVSHRLERQTTEVTEEKEEFLRLMNMSHDHLNFIEAKGRKEAAELIDKLDAKIRDTLVLRMREAIISEESIKEALRQSYPDLTDAEIEVALLVVNDKTVSEICEIRHVAPSTVTSIRSRLRKKTGLAPGESLKCRLTAVVNRYNATKTYY